MRVSTYTSDSGVEESRLVLSSPVAFLIRSKTKRFLAK